MRKQTKLIVALSATALLAIGASAVAMADGWDNSSGDWRYLDKSGNSVTDVWRKSGDFWFYLGSDGRMVREELIDYKDNYYYVNADGAMVTNTWVPLDVDDSDDDAEYRWYYFGSDGKAYKNSESTLKTKDIKTINGKKYAFDEDGRMLYGWVSNDLDISSNDDEDWQTDDYYFGGWNDGSAQNGWVQLTVDTEGISDDDEGTFWFYFDSNGKKKANKKFAVDGKTYYFDQYGRMIEDWVDSSTGNAAKYVQLGDDQTSLKGNERSDRTTSSNADIIYTNGDGSARKNAWVWAIPSEAQNASDNEDDEYSWWYAESSGKVKKNGVKKVNGKYYVFDKIGRMKSGLLVTFGNDSTYATNSLYNYYDSSDVRIGEDKDLTEYSASDYLALRFQDVDYAYDTQYYESDSVPLTKYGTADYNIYYYSNDGEKDGSRKTGYQNVEFDDGVYQMYFNTSSGKALDEYSTKIKKFVSKGIVLKANVDDSNYGAVEAAIFGSNSYDLIRHHYNASTGVIDDTDFVPEVTYQYEDAAEWNLLLYAQNLIDKYSEFYGYDAATLAELLAYEGVDLDEMSALTDNNTGYADFDRGYGYFVLVNSSGAVQKKKKNLKDNNDIYYFTDDAGAIVYAGSRKLVSKSISSSYPREDAVLYYGNSYYFYDD